LIKLIAIATMLAALALPAAAQTQAPIRINCGGPSYTDSKGQVWSSDTGYVGVASTDSTTEAIKGTEDQKLFQSWRWSAVPSSPVVYQFSVPGGTYRVNLYFAENTPADEYVGGRVFNVKMQGSVVFNKLDIFAEVGADTALVRSADIAATNGQLRIELDAAIHNPKIDAIEIVQTSAAPEMKMNFTYPDGTPVVGTLHYKMSTSLLSLGGNTPLRNGQTICYLFASPSVMGLAGTFQVNLSLTDSAAHTLWQLSLSLDPASANISGVQSTALNVVVAKQ
jgi:hypothetical protein